MANQCKYEGLKCLESEEAALLHPLTIRALAQTDSDFPKHRLAQSKKVLQMLGGVIGYFVATNKSGQFWAGTAAAQDYEVLRLAGGKVAARVAKYDVWLDSGAARNKEVLELTPEIFKSAASSFNLNERESWSRFTKLLLLYSKAKALSGIPENFLQGRCELFERIKEQKVAFQQEIQDKLNIEINDLKTSRAKLELFLCVYLCIAKLAGDGGRQTRTPSEEALIQVLEYCFNKITDLMPHLDSDVLAEVSMEFIEYPIALELINKLIGIKRMGNGDEFVSSDESKDSGETDHIFY